MIPQVEHPYRNRTVVRQLAEAIRETAAGLGDISIMHVCGTHEHEIRRHALRQLFPRNVRLIAGPGCPVCITPASVIATAIAFTRLLDSPILCTYGDMANVPISQGSLFESRREGADIRLIYNIRDTVKIARENPDRNVIFFSVGFETTAAPVAVIISSGVPDNLLIYPCHRYVPAALGAMVANDPESMDGYLLPGHASIITGIGPYEFLSRDYGRAAAVTGFEPVDILTGMLSVLRQIGNGRPTVANCYPRAVRDEGNTRARDMIANVFRTVDAHWRGIGILPGTGLALRDEYMHLDALSRYSLQEVASEDILPGCNCHLVIMGRKIPTDCGLFGTSCTPEHPHGPCMVSAEGTCRACYLYPEADHV